MSSFTFDKAKVRLPYDSLSNWNNSTRILLIGEVAIAKVSDNKVMIKIGDGSHTFKQLPDALYAKASDVVEACKSTSSLQTFINNLINPVKSSLSSSIADVKSVADSAKSDVDILKGSDSGKSTRTIASEEVTKVIADAPESFDTLKEISDWISNHKDDAAAMNSAILKLESILDGIGGEGEQPTVVQYVTDAIDALNIGDYAKAADLTELGSQIVSKLNTKVDKEEGKGLSTNDFTNDYKTKLDGIQTGAEANVQADWTQNDETADDYVKNRPGGYVGLTEILPETTLDFTDSNNLYLTNCPLIEVGVQYTVTFDNTEYELVGRNDSAGMGYICIGNELLTWYGTDTGEPFIIYNDGGEAPVIYISSSTTLPCTYNIKIKAVAPVKINEKYLDIKNTNIVNGSAVGSLRTVGSIEENSSYTMGGYAFAEGADTTASGWNSHAEGNGTTASGDTSHAEGNGTTASGDTSHAEGNGTTASGYYSHAEGVHSEASGTSSHAEGSNTTAGLRGFRVTACEKLTDTTGTYTLRSVAGLSTNQRYSVHLSSSKENCGKITAIDTTNKKITVDGYPDIALGSGIINYLTIVNKPNLGDRVVSGDDSHAEGYFTTASGNYQHAQGKYNIVDTSNTYADIIGNGSFNTRSNAATVDWQGNAWYAGDVYVGSTSGTNRDEGSKKLATEEYVDTGLTSKVDKEEGKGLSTNDFTNDYKTKLDGIEYRVLNNKLYAKAFKVLATDAINKTYTLDSVNGLSTDMEYSVRFSSVKIKCGKISNIEGNVITVTNYPDIPLDSTDTNYITIVGRPDLGTFEVGEHAISIGEPDNFVQDRAAYSEGRGNITAGQYGHSEGRDNLAGYASHAEGRYTQAIGNYSHSENLSTQATGYASHAEGNTTIASGINSHAEGADNEASGNNAHSEGSNTLASGDTSHAEGISTIASGQYSHAEGNGTQATGYASHASGWGTIASQTGQTAIGHYNKNNKLNLFEIGNGSDNNNRSNAFSVNADGWAELAMQGNTDKSVVIKEYVDTGLTSKVDKEDGKSLSTNDFTNDYKTKLDGIELGANKTIIDSELSDTSTNPVQNKIINAALGNINTALDRIIEIQNSLIGGN